MLLNNQEYSAEHSGTSCNRYQPKIPNSRIFWTLTTFGSNLSKFTPQRDPLLGSLFWGGHSQDPEMGIRIPKWVSGSRNGYQVVRKQTGFDPSHRRTSWSTRELPLFLETRVLTSHLDIDCNSIYQRDWELYENTWTCLVWNWTF